MKFVAHIDLVNWGSDAFNASHALDMVKNRDQIENHNFIANEREISVHMKRIGSG